MPRIRPIQAACLLILSSIFVERLLRQGARARSLDEGMEDRGSTRAVGSAWGMAFVALLAAPLLNKLRLGRIFSDNTAWAGVVVALCGLLFRTWPTRVLGSYYARTLRTQQGQRLITEGLYKLLCHPGYVGSLLLWLATRVATTNAITTMAVSIPMARAYLARMKAEEAMLADAFPQEYPAYAQRTWRLIPFIY